MKFMYGLAAAAAFSLPLQAAVSGYQVVLVHGFQPAQLKSKPDATAVEQDGATYWQSFWNAKADARIDWPSHERISGKIATHYLWPQLQQLSRNGTCRTGCIFVSHSTGDLVTRYIIDNQALWLQNAGLTPLNIVATFDFAGAGGGSELADLAVNVATGGSGIDAALKAAIRLWLGETPTAGNVGVLNDLRVNSARQLSAVPDSRVPRLRFAGAATAFYGATSPFLPGNDDGVVSPHSSCGAATAAAFDSCSSSIAFDGKLSSPKGVSQFMPYHYPLLMSGDYHHSNLIDAQRQGLVTAANKQKNYLDGRTLQFSTYDESRGWWVFKSQYRVVSGSDLYSMSDLLYRTAEQR
jgi:hypothetical protein